jgi:hypothetical protein
VKRYAIDPLVPKGSPAPGDVNYDERKTMENLTRMDMVLAAIAGVILLAGLWMLLDGAWSARE